MRRPVAQLFLSLACLVPFGAGFAKEPYSPAPHTTAPACVTCAIPGTVPDSGTAPVCFYPRGIIVGQVSNPPPESFCACDGQDEDVSFGMPVPGGIMFTGRCIRGSGCEFLPLPDVEKTLNVKIPAGYCAAHLTIKMDTDAPIIVCTDNSHCPAAGTEYPATRYDPQPQLVPCPGSGPQPGPGELLSTDPCVAPETLF